MENKPVYLDYSATTPIEPRVVEAMMPYLTDSFGNPASRSHSFGWSAEQAVESSRKFVSELVSELVPELVSKLVLELVSELVLALVLELVLGLVLKLVLSIFYKMKCF